MPNNCPYGADVCPKVSAMDERIDMIEANQKQIMRLVYYIAGIVSVSLGLTGGLLL